MACMFIVPCPSEFSILVSKLATKCVYSRMQTHLATVQGMCVSGSMSLHALTGWMGPILSTTGTLHNNGVRKGATQLLAVLLLSLGNFGVGVPTAAN